MNQTPVYILAGGRSSRFGSDKSRALLGGVPLIEHVAACAGLYSPDITVVAQRPDAFADLGLRTIGDDEPYQGPLSGLRSALLDIKIHAPQAAWLLLLACDQPDVRLPWIQTLHDHLSPQRRAVAFQSDRWLPMPGFYHASILPKVQELLAGGKGSMQRLLSALDAHPVRATPEQMTGASINTPADLERFEPTLPADSSPMTP